MCHHSNNLCPNNALGELFVLFSKLWCSFSIAKIGVHLVSYGAEPAVFSFIYNIIKIEIQTPI